MQQLKEIYIWITLISLSLAFQGCGIKKDGFDSELYPIFVKGKWGAITSTGKLQIPIEYDWLYYNRFGNGLILVEKDSMKLVINQKNNVVFNNIHYQTQVIIMLDSIKLISEMDTSILSLSNRNGYLNKPNKNCHNSELEKIQLVQLSERQFVFQTQNGQLLIRDTFKMASSFSDRNITMVVGKDFWGYINRSGSYIWRNHIGNLNDYWEFEQIKKVDEVQNYQELFEKNLSNRELITFYLHYLKLDLESEFNIDFMFFPYQIGFQMY